MVTEIKDGERIEKEQSLSEFEAEQKKKVSEIRKEEAAEVELRQKKKRGEVSESAQLEKVGGEFVVIDVKPSEIVAETSTGKQLTQIDLQRLESEKVNIIDPITGEGGTFLASQEARKQIEDIAKKESRLRQDKKSIQKELETQKLGPRKDLISPPETDSIIGPTSTFTAASPELIKATEKAKKKVPALQAFFEGFSLDPTSEQRVRAGTTLEAIAFTTGAAAGIGVEGIGGLLGKGISKVPILSRVATKTGAILTTKPAIFGFTFLAGTEFAKRLKEGDSEEVARFGANILRDIGLFSSVVKELPIQPIKTPLDPFLRVPIRTAKVEIPTAEGTQTFRTLGIDIGTRGQPLITQTPEGIKIGTPKIEQRIPISEISSPIAQPETALGGKIFREAIDFTPKEITRIESLVGASRILGQDVGIDPKEFLFKVEGLKKPEVSTDIITEFIKAEEGVVFGSVVTERLPTEFRSAKVGDIDIFIEGQRVEQIQPKLATLAERLQLAGEKVKVDPDTLSIKFESDGKLLEVKSGIDQDILGLEDTAPSKFLGFDVAETKGVKFGEIESITAGQQFLRKGAASSIVSPPSKGAEFTSFQEGGLVGKITVENPRGTKDIAGFLQTGRGLAALRETSIDPIKRARGRKATRELERFSETFSPKQRADIELKIADITGKPIRERIKLDIERPVELVGPIDSPRLSKTPEVSIKGPISFIEISEKPKVELPSTISDIPSDDIIIDGDTSPIIVSDAPSVSILPSSSKTSKRPSSTSKIPTQSPISTISEISLISPPSPPSGSSILSPPSPPFKTTKSPPSPPILSDPFKIGKKQRDLFKVEVGKIDNKVFFEETGLELEEAIEFGKKGTRKTAAASFRIIPEDEDKLDIEERFKITSLLGGDFRRSKALDDVFVQKRAKRISSFGEKQEITQLGLASLKKSKFIF